VLDSEEEDSSSVHAFNTTATDRCVQLTST